MKKNKMAPGLFRRHPEWIWGYLFILPAIVGGIMFGFYPLVRSLYSAFTEWNGMTDPVFIGLQNFKNLFQDEKFYMELRNTLVFAFVSTPVAMLLSIALANALNDKRGPVGVMRVIYYLPAVTMPVAIAAVWRWMYNDRAGLINSFLGFFGIKGPSWLSDPQWALISVIIVVIWSGLGYNMIVLLASLKNIPATYYEAAKIDGANAGQVFWSITMPLLSPTIFFLLITSLIGAFKAFDIVYMFAGQSFSSTPVVVNATRTIVFGVYEQGFKFMNMGYATAEATILLAIILVVTGIQFLVQKYWVNYDI